MFTGFETEKFPIESCTIQNSRENDIKDAPDEEVYLCVIVDKRWPSQCRLEHLRPYVAKDGRKTLFGWTRIDFDGYVDHLTRPIHYDYERVVAWKKVEAVTNFSPKDWPEAPWDPVRLHGSANPS